MVVFPSNTVQAIVATIYESNTSYRILQRDTDKNLDIKHSANDVKLIMLPNAPLHIIDYWSVVCLNLLQICFYDQQDSLLCFL